MRRLLLVACSTVVLGCAHHEARNLAQRQPTTTPHSDFDGARRGDHRDQSRPIEPPIVTPPIP
jgi:hypothetical protein